MAYRYSILTFIIGKGYEKVHEITSKQDDVEYILVTDDEDLKSDTWKVVYDKSLFNIKTSFEKCFSIRYNVFKYCNTDVCVTIDGSMEVKGSLDRLIQKFNNEKYDICLMPHPLWSNMVTEYGAWVKMRGYPFDRANRMLNIMALCNYDVKANFGLFQLCFSIKRRNQLTQKIDDNVFSMLKIISNKSEFERLDQTWYSFIVNTQFNNIKILPVSEQVVRSNAIQWYWHNSDQPNNNIYYDINNPDIKIVCGKEVECLYLK